MNMAKRTVGDHSGPENTGAMPKGSKADDGYQPAPHLADGGSFKKAGGNVVESRLNKGGGPNYGSRGPGRTGGAPSKSAMQ